MSGLQNGDGRRDTAKDEAGTWEAAATTAVT